MTSEKQYILDTFSVNFSSYKGKKLALYGLGDNTKLLLDSFPDYNFVGLMDEVRTGDTIWGLPVLSCEVAYKIGIEAIIIIARAANVSIIYNRIAELCDSFSIPVFNIQGEKLSLHKRNPLIGKGKIFNKRADLLQKIDSCQIISFDIFDTILMRKVLVPTDIFSIMEKRIEANGCIFPFFKERRKAELELLREGEQPKLKDIYDRMMLHFPWIRTHKNEWMKLEIEIEKEYLLSRNEMKEILAYARQSGKQVFFTSDMYLTSEILADLLCYAGIDAKSENVIISCEYGLSKSNGLHGILRKRFLGNRILHIGDNAEADGRCAKDAGIDDIFLIDSTYALLEKSYVDALLKFSGKLSNRMIIGEFAARQFNNPFIFERTGGKLCVDTEYELGYYFLAPILTVFIQWLLQKVKEYKLTKLLLSSRDGYIIKELLDKVRTMFPDTYLPEYIYFYTSRAVCVRAAIQGTEDIMYAAQQIPFSGTAEELLQKRFGIKLEELLPRNKEETDIVYIMRHKKVILNCCYEARCRYERYLVALDIQREDRCGYFDFVSGGTCQYALSKFWGIDMKGLYFLNFYDPVKEGLSIDALYQEPNIYAKTSAVEEKYFLLEKIITSYEPTLTDFDNMGRPLFGKEDRPKEELDSLRQIHKGILDGFMKDDIKDKNMADEFVRLLDKDYILCSLPFLKSFYMTDDFCNRSFEISGF